MKILKLLNRISFSIILISFLSLIAYAEDQPVDIWNIEKENKKKNLSSEEVTEETDSISVKDSETDIFSMQSKKKSDSIKLEQSLETNDIKIFGLYDPEDYDLDINMWSTSDGDQLKNIFLRLNKIDLSDDATEIVKIALLTNAYSPEINISEKDFLNLK